MVGHEALDLAAEVRILLPQPRTRISLFVSRESQEDLKRTIPLGFEADPNASSGGRMSGMNGSEDGRSSEDE